jgi:hypothetical protein
VNALDTVARGSSRQPVNRAELEQFFTNVSTRLHQVDGTPANSVSRVQLDTFFRVVGNILAASEKSRLRHDKNLATGFNVFHFIELDENRLSDVLAFLLNPKDTHGQSDLFLRLMFSQLGLDADAKHTQHATVRREAATHRILNSRRRMDILVEAGALLAIENKIDSVEQLDQVKDYLEHLHHCTRDGFVRAALIYLSPNGRPPESINQLEIDTLTATGKLHCWSYHDQLRQWLDSCHQKCAAPRIRAFLTDLMAYIEVQYQREPANYPEIDDYEK